ncbi:Hypothetical predicted protein, partial [Scomber scombrus]
GRVSGGGGGYRTHTWGSIISSPLCSNTPALLSFSARSLQFSMRNPPAPAQLAASPDPLQVPRRLDPLLASRSSLLPFQPTFSPSNKPVVAQL